MMACVNIEAVLQDLIETVRAAGEVTQAHFARFREIDVEVKGPGDFVSDADRESETLIRDRLLSRYPGFSLSGEEFAPVDGSDPDYRFLVHQLPERPALHDHHRAAPGRRDALRSGLRPGGRRDVHRRQGRRSLPQR
jgi:3'-phosphoadenosine 5'-phosphosulfate (PAPS) 3'-phosphatase